MALNSEVDMIRTYKESRIGIWVGDKHNSIRNLHQCLEYLNENKESGLVILRNHIHKTLEQWNKVDNKELGSIIEIPSNVRLSGILLMNGEKSGEYRGYLRFNTRDKNLSRKLKFTLESSTLNWITVNNSKDGFTANISYNLSNNILLAEIIFHQTIHKNRIELQEVIGRFILDNIMKKS
ncbi:hypothetical protein QNH36_22460 [Mesobacillus sp. AQ2]|uniref:hypothetical protein n=1 Tax=Mesobacillus sp. AQ2 TaxID=3043332 RepID=UPI0024C16411|nr:hypothetical protein [Mesobacillus sp. AQ2]WHX40370.1 hypothetical protein QNH36_22460 [Mesobacillus sp. AQ2]